MRRRAMIMGLSMFFWLTGCSAGGSDAVPTPDATQQAAMRDPTAVVRLVADLEKQERYAAIAPLLTDATRSALIKDAGSIEKHYRNTTQRTGKLLDYQILGTRMIDSTTAEVDATFKRSVTTFNNTVILKKGAQGWQWETVRQR